MNEIGSALHGEVERAFLAAMMFSPKLISRVRKLPPEDFGFQGHGSLWRALVALHDRKQAVGLDGLKTVLNADEITALGGDDYLLGIRHALVSAYPPQMEDYANTIRELANRRRMLDLCREVMTTAEHGSIDFPFSQAVGRYIQDCRKIMDQASTAPVVDNVDVAMEILEDMRVPAPHFSTGFPSLDVAMGGGLFAGKAYGIVARKKVGKTALAGSISFNLAQQGHRHLFVCMEMGRKEIEQRNIARRLGINSARFLHPPTDAFMQNVSNVSTTQPRMVEYFDRPGLPLAQLQDEVYRICATKNVTGMIIDYVQLIGGREPKQSQSDHLDVVCQWIAEVCRSEKIWAIVLGQINQTDNVRGGEGMRLAFDQVYALHRERGAEYAWMECWETRYTPHLDVGAADDLRLGLCHDGPHFFEVPPPEKIS